MKAKSTKKIKSSRKSVNLPVSLKLEKIPGEAKAEIVKGLGKSAVMRKYGNVDLGDGIDRARAWVLEAVDNLDQFSYSEVRKRVMTLESLCRSYLYEWKIRNHQ